MNVKIFWFYRSVKVLCCTAIILSLCQCSSESIADKRSDSQKLSAYQEEVTTAITYLNIRLFHLRNTIQSGDRSAMHEAALELKSAYYASFRINTFKPELQNEIAENYVDRMAESFWTYRETLKAIADSIEIMTNEGLTPDLENKIKSELNLLSSTSNDIATNLKSAYQALDINPNITPSTQPNFPISNQDTGTTTSGK